jgi:hypothetical protein
MTFVVEETKIQAHKLVLAMRSPVLAAQLYGEKKDGIMDTCLKVEDMSPSTFRAMLRFIYTDELPIKPSNKIAFTSRACKEKVAARRRAAMARDLLVAAERYGLEKLRLMCQKIFFQNSDAIPILTIDRGRHGCEQFQTSGIDYTATSSPNTTAGAGAPIILPSSSIITHLEKLLVNKEWSDVTFLVEESQIYAHRLIIAARSVVLHEAVVSCKDNHDVVRIKDMKAAIFKAILHFIYTDELPPMDDLLVVADGHFVMVAGDMLMAACRFNLGRMKAMCENLLAEFVTKGNVLSILKRARCYNCPNLEDYCIEFISLPRNIKDVISLFSLN